MKRPVKPSPARTVFARDAEGAARCLVGEAEVELLDYQEKSYFTPFELEHILGIPLSDVVEIFAGVPKVKQPAGCFEGDESRKLVEKWARKRVYADVIARNAVNAVPEIRRLQDEGNPLEIKLEDVTHQHVFTVRFPGDLRLYLQSTFRPKAEQESSSPETSTPS